MCQSGSVSEPRAQDADDQIKPVSLRSRAADPLAPEFMPVERFSASTPAPARRSVIVIVSEALPFVRSSLSTRFALAVIASTLAAFGSLRRSLRAW